MNKKDIANIVMRLFLYADMCKMIHYTTRKIHCHKLCDEVRDTIMEFADDLAEICKNVVKLVEELRQDIDGSDVYAGSGIVSIIDDFKSNMAQKVYLANFDNVSDARLNEVVTKAINKIKSIKK